MGLTATPCWQMCPCKIWTPTLNFTRYSLTAHYKSLLYKSLCCILYIKHFVLAALVVYFLKNKTYRLSEAYDMFSCACATKRTSFIARACILLRQVRYLGSVKSWFYEIYSLETDSCIRQKLFDTLVTLLKLINYVFNK